MLCPVLASRKILSGPVDLSGSLVFRIHVVLYFAFPSPRNTILFETLLKRHTIFPTPENDTHMIFSSVIMSVLCPKRSPSGTGEAMSY